MQCKSNSEGFGGSLSYEYFSFDKLLFSGFAIIKRDIAGWGSKGAIQVTTRSPVEYATIHWLSG